MVIIGSPSHMSMKPTSVVEPWHRLWRAVLNTALRARHAWRCHDGGNAQYLLPFFWRHQRQMLWIMGAIVNGFCLRLPLSRGRARQLPWVWLISTLSLIVLHYMSLSLWRMYEQRSCRRRTVRKLRRLLLASITLYVAFVFLLYRYHTPHTNTHCNSSFFALCRNMTRHCGAYLHMHVPSGIHICILHHERHVTCECEMSTSCTCAVI